MADIVEAPRNPRGAVVLNKADDYLWHTAFTIYV
jgi:hypothetical protein